MITKLKCFFDTQPYLFWNKMSEWQIAQIIAYSPVLKHIHIMLCPKYPLFQWFCNLVFGDKTLHSLNRIPLTLINIFQGSSIVRPHIHIYVFIRNSWVTTFRTGFHLHIDMAFRTMHMWHCTTTAIAQYPKAHAFALRTLAHPNFHINCPNWTIH